MMRLRQPRSTLFPYTTLFRSEKVLGFTTTQKYEAYHEKVTGLSSNTLEGVMANPTNFYEHTSNQDRKSTRLNSSHVAISYAVFCLKKKKIYNISHKIKKNQSN